MYVMDDAVDETPPVEGELAVVPVPPCCVLLGGGAGVRLEIADRGTAAGIVSIRPDDVLLQTRSSVANEKCNEEILEWLARALALRRSTLSVCHLRPLRVLLAASATVCQILSPEGRLQIAVLSSEVLHRRFSCSVFSARNNLRRDPRQRRAGGERAVQAAQGGAVRGDVARGAVWQAA